MKYEQAKQALYDYLEVYVAKAIENKTCYIRQSIAIWV